MSSFRQLRNKTSPGDWKLHDAYDSENDGLPFVRGISGTNSELCS